MNQIRTRTLLLLAALASSAGTAAAQSDQPLGEQFTVEFGVMWWRPSPALTIQTGALAEEGFAQFDLAEELGFTDVWSSDYRITVKTGRAHRIRFGYTPLRYDQGGPLSRAIFFGDEVFTGNAAADIRWDIWRFGYAWDFLRRDRGALGLLVELKYNDVRAEVRSRGRGELAEATAPVPTVGLIGRGHPHPRVTISGEFAALKIPGDSLEATFIDIDFSAAVSITRNLGVQAGYRAVTADYLVDDDRGDLSMKGLYVGFLSRF